MDKLNKIFCLFIIVIIGFVSCTNKTYNVRLAVDTENSMIVEPLFAYDSIIVKNSKDSIAFIKYSNGRPFITSLFKRDSDFYEIRKTQHLSLGADSLSIDTLITLSKRNISYDFERGLISLTAFGLQYGSMHYEFTKESDMYKTLKRSFQDSTYTEVFYYDNNYRILKFVNTWRDNKIVYTIAK